MGDDRGDDADQRRADVYSSARIGAAAALTIVLVVLLVLDVAVPDYDISPSILLPLLGASILVLLIACGNAAALLLVRGLQRQPEYAVKAALGAGRIGLFRQASSESIVLALTGGTLGVALAFGIVKLFKIVGVHAIPRLAAVTTGWPVLVSLSNKDFVGETLDLPVGERLSHGPPRRRRSRPGRAP